MGREAKPKKKPDLEQSGRAEALLRRQTLELSRLVPEEQPWQDLRESGAVLERALKEALALTGFECALALVETTRGGDLEAADSLGIAERQVALLRERPLKNAEHAALLGALRLLEPGLEAVEAHAPLAACFPKPLGGLVSLALTERGRLKGALLLASAKPLDPEVLPLVRSLGPVLAAQAAGALRGAELFERLVARTRELERVVADLSKVQRRADLVQLSAAVAHQIRNPLSVVAVHVDLLRERAGGDAGQLETLDLLSKKVGEANATVQQLLELSRPLALQMKPTALGPLLRSFVGFIQPKCRLQGVTLECSLEEGLPAVWAEENALQRCLLDLCLNALELLGNSSAGRIGLRAVRNGSGVALSVNDNGPGIPEKMLPLLFEPFSSGRAGGTGLGLYNVRRICREMGAGVMAGSLADGGSRFCLYLRVEPSETPPQGGEA